MRDPFKPEWVDVLLTGFEPILSETWLVGLDEFFSAIEFLQEVCDSLLEDTDPLREEFVEEFLAWVVEDDILVEVGREAYLMSLEELSSENSLAELSDLGGELDLELAFEDFLEEAEELLEVFLMDVVELFQVEVA